MEPITWSDDRLLGIDSLDQQHRTLVDCINKLVTECRKSGTDTHGSAGEKREKLARLFDELYTTAKAHFSYEETMMRDMNYPGYAAHAREHVMLIAELKSSFANTLKQAQCSVTPELLQALKSWLIAHVSRSDRDFAKYFLEQNAQHETAQTS